MCNARMRFVLMGACILFACGRQRSSQVKNSEATTSAVSTTLERAAPTTVMAAGPRKLALLVGINNYKYPKAVSKLNGAVNDIEDMKDLLVSYGFRTSDIVMLPDNKATKANIVKEFQDHLIGKATPGDLVVFHFSGHGSQMNDPMDRLGYDNTLVPYDSRDPGKTTTDLRDKELNALLKRLARKMGLLGGEASSLKQGSITVILDSCYSGTGTRSSGQPRLAPKDTRFGNNPPPPETFGEESHARDADNNGFSSTDADNAWVTIAGSQTDQRSYELLKDSKDHGALTYYLAQELRKPSPVKRTYREIRDRVVPAVQGDYPNQRPQFEGPNLDRVVFGDETIGFQNYILADPVGTKEVTLKGGRLHGFTPNSEFDIYSPDARKLEPPELPIARVILKDVIGEATSPGEIKTGKQVPAGSKAVERVHNFESQKTRLLFEDLSRSTALQKIKTQLDRHPGKPFEAVAPDQPFQIRLEEDKSIIRTFGPDGIELSTGISVIDAALADTIERRLLGWARWLNLLALRNPASSLSVDFALKIKNGGGTLVDSGHPPSFTPGPDRYEVTMKNRSSRKLFVYILDFTSAGRSKLIYPPANSTEPLEPGKDRSISGGTSLPDLQTRYVRDVYKLIATTEPVDLAFLEQDTPKGSDAKKVPKPPTDRLNRLLFEAALGRRDGELAVPTEWVTADQAFEVCRILDGNGRCEAIESVK